MNPPPATFSVATWNVNSIRARQEHLEKWLNAQRPDYLALQETKIQDPDFPHDSFTDVGYSAAVSGQKSYNGVAVLSREPIEAVATEIPGFSDPQRRILGVATQHGYVLNLYVPNGAAVGTEKYAYKLTWLQALTDWLPALIAQYGRVVVVGDFNIAPDDRDVHDADKWRGKILCSEPERGSLQKIMATGFVDIFRNFVEVNGHYSWWDYRAGAFRRDHGLRIDLILASAALATRAHRCEIDREPRAWQRPSDHAPVIAHFAND